MIIFDLDGTLADCQHRRHFVTPPKATKYIYTDSVPHKNGCILYGEYRYEDDKTWKPDWKSFFESCDKDIVIEQTREILWKLDPYKTKIEIWSGRCESVREKTEEWIIDQVFLGNFVSFDQIELKMRQIGDNTPDDQLKELWLDNYLTHLWPELPPPDAENQDKVYYRKDAIDYVFDDGPKAVRMWRRRGIFVFDCNQTGREF